MDCKDLRSNSPAEDTPQGSDDSRLGGVSRRIGVNSPDLWQRTRTQIISGVGFYSQVELRAPEGQRAREYAKCGDASLVQGMVNR